MVSAKLRHQYPTPRHHTHARIVAWARIAFYLFGELRHGGRMGQLWRSTIAGSSTTGGGVCRCFNGSDSRLRDLSEQSFDEVIRLLDQASASLMSIRILDAKGRFDRRLREFIPKGPDTTPWLNLLGKVRRQQHERSEAILNDLCEKIEALTAKLEAEGIEPEAIDILRAPTASGIQSELLLTVSAQ